MQLWKNGRLLPQSSSPPEYSKKNNPATLCQASPILGWARSSFPSKIPSVGKCRQLQPDYLGILKAEESQVAREPSFYFKSSGP